jgi:hypothetical protein
MIDKRLTFREETGFIGTPIYGFETSPFDDKTPYNETPVLQSRISDCRKVVGEGEANP